MKQKPEPEDKEKNEKYYDKVSQLRGFIYNHHGFMCCE